MGKAYAFVHITDIAYGADKEYAYRIPDILEHEIKIGSVVIVPFGRSNKKVSAVVTKLSDDCDYPRCKPVFDVMRYPFDVPEELIATCSFMKERFFCTFGAAFRTVIPPGVNLNSETVYSAVREQEENEFNDAATLLIRRIKEKGVIPEKALIEEFGDEVRTLLASLCKNGIIEKSSRVPEKLNEKNRFTVTLTVSPEDAYELAESGEGLTEKQRGLIEFLIHFPAATLREIDEIGGYSVSVVNTLVKKGLAEKKETNFVREAYSFEGVEPEKDFTLSEEQQGAIGGLCALADDVEAKAALLFGVTGSGKTRVIIETCKHIIANGKKAIVLIPEIALASQAVKAYAAAFGNKLAIIHSMLSVGERTDTYRKIVSGDVDIVIGTRSAIFAPFSDIGIIAIDEEQAHTYKSETTPKYSALDVARFRCGRHKALMLLASATPSIESFYKAKKGNYTLFRLENRFGGTELPDVIIEDMRDDPTLMTEKLIGKRLGEEIKAAKENGKQTILFVNRRGFNSHVACRECGYVFTCPHCSVALTHHKYGAMKNEKRLFCHYCGYSDVTPSKCPVCGGTKISYSGFGTQRLEEELENDFEGVSVSRLDSDTTTGKFSHDKITSDFSEGKSDILVGTQMVSKGLDFPKVKLAAAISVDGALYMDDFRAGERTFSLLTQLVGRAGRGKERGKAILQTYNPDNEVLRLAAKQDYEGFFESEIKLRKAVLFPPFCSIAVFCVSSSSEENCEKFAQSFNLSFMKAYGERQNKFTLLKFGPFPHGIYKIKGKFRQRIIVKYSDGAEARSFFSQILAEGITAAPNGVYLDIDVNPTII